MTLGFHQKTPLGVLEQHAHKREHLIRRSAFSSVIGRVVAAVCMMVQVPLALHYLGTEEFGFWMTITGVMLMLGFADLGLGNGLQNRVAELYGADDLAAIRQAWICGVKMLVIIGVIVFLLSILIVPSVNWSRLFHLKEAKTMASASLYAGCLIQFLHRPPSDVSSKSHPRHTTGVDYQPLPGRRKRFELDCGLSGNSVKIRFRSIFGLHPSDAATGKSLFGVVDDQIYKKRCVGGLRADQKPDLAANRREIFYSTVKWPL